MTAVLVSHDGARWLPQVLEALAAQTRDPDVLVAVDTASTDDSVALLTAALGADSVFAADRDTGFGGAVGHALDRLADHNSPPPEGGWIWLLHDDCAPAPDALERLLHEATGPGAGPEIAVVGPKVREWPSLRRLVEVGVTIAGTGARETGLEPGEPDQGQRDDPRQVLAVGTAGALVRRSTWSALGGLAPQLPLFGDDLDLGWRVARAGSQVRVAPAAMVFHAEAATRDLRTPGALTGSARRGQRSAALFVLLANCRGAVLPVQYVRLLLGSVLRAVGLLLLKAPREAWDEIVAAVSVLAWPWRLMTARRSRRATAQAPPAVVRPLLPSVVQPYRDGAATAADVAGALLAPSRSTVPRSVAEPGPVSVEAEALPAEPGPLARVRARPWASAVLVLALLTVVAARTLLTGGELYGGALLPAPGGALDWWAAYTAGWHPVGTGSAEPSPPYVLLLAGAGLATLGDAGAAVSLLVLGAPVLAALTAHRLLRRAGAGPVAAAWASLAYGSLPLVTGAVAQGRLGTVLGTVVLPVLATTVLSLSTADSSGTGPARLERWIRRSRAGLAAAVLVAVAPVAWPLLVVAAVLVVVLAVVLAVVTSGRRPGRRVATPPLPQVVVSSAVVVAVPWLLGPWWLAERIADPMLFWWEAGLPDAGVGALDPGPVDLALGMPGGPGGAVAWLGAGVLLAAVVALARTSRRGPVLVAWTAGALGLLTAAVGVLADGAGDPTTGLTTVWVGFPLVVWWGGLVTAVAVGSHDLGPMLAGRSFGWRQLTVAGVAVLALLGPLVALGWAVAEGIATPLTRAEAVPLPAYMAEDARAGPRPSVAVLAGSTDQLAATIVREDGWRIGEEPMWAAAAPPALTEPLSRLLAAPTEDDLDAIAGLGVGYLYAPAPVDPKLAAALDSAPGIAPAGAPEGDRGWRLDRPAGTLQTDSRALALSTDRADGGPPWTVTPARAPRQVSLAAAPAPGWTAELDGRRLQAAPGDRAVQTFAVPQPVPAKTDGRLTVSYDDDRSWWVAGQLVALVAVVLLAAPSRRGRP